MVAVGGKQSQFESSYRQVMRYQSRQLEALDEARSTGRFHVQEGKTERARRGQKTRRRQRCDACRNLPDLIASGIHKYRRWSLLPHALPQVLER